MDLLRKLRFWGAILWSRMSGDCIFCRIVAGTAPAVMLYEDEAAAVFLDIRPLVPGHALAVPKVHCTDLRDCPEDALGPLLSAAKKVAPALLEAAGADGFNLIAANGPSAGQEVYHLHLHLFPRRKGDGFTRRSFAEQVGKARVVPHRELESFGERVRSLLGQKVS